MIKTPTNIYTFSRPTKSAVTLAQIFSFQKNKKDRCVCGVTHEEERTRRVDAHPAKSPLLLGRVSSTRPPSSRGALRPPPNCARLVPLLYIIFSHPTENAQCAGYTFIRGRSVCASSSRLCCALNFEEEEEGGDLLLRPRENTRSFDLTVTVVMDGGSKTVESRLCFN